MNSLLLNEHPFETGEVVLNVAEGPDHGTPVVLVHGLTAAWQAWSQLIPQLTRRWHVFAVDLRGHGKSSRPQQGYRLEDYVRDLAAFLEHGMPEPAVLIGHSLGAVACLFTGAKAPGWVRQLILCEPPLFNFHHPITHVPRALEWFRFVEELGSLHSLEEVKERLHAYSPTDNEASLNALAETLYHVAPRAAAAGADDSLFRGYDLPAALRGITCPAVFLQGERSLGGTMWDEDAQTVREHLPTARIIKFPNVGHNTHLEVDTIVEQIGIRE